jgi:hypothetical protein
MMRTRDKNVKPAKTIPIRELLRLPGENDDPRDTATLAILYGSFWLLSGYRGGV